MRFLGCLLQFALIIVAFCILSGILPQVLLNIFALIAQVFLCFCMNMWIIELTQDYFFHAKVKTKHKAVLITGCDSGFGNAFAKLLDKKGYHVFACCYDKLSDGANNLKDTCSSRLKIIQLDVTSDESVQEAFTTVEKTLDKSELWAIVNNAGVLEGFQIELSSMKHYEDCIQVNTLGMIRVTKAFLPLLRRSRGRVVNICSMSGRMYCPFLGPYTISKHAAIAFTEILRQEMREFGLRVISIEPEFFKTPMCSEKYIQNVLNQSLFDVNEEIKSAYGSKYIERAKHIYLTLFSKRSRKVERVLHATEAAVSLENPADVYKPCRNVFIRTVFFVAERVSGILVQLTVIFIQIFMGLPKPETGVNLSSRILNM